MGEGVEIKFLAQTAEAAEKVNKFIEGTVDGLKELALAFGIAFGLEQIAEFIKESVNAADALGKLSKQTTLSIDTLDALRRAASENNVAFDELKGGLALFVEKTEAARLHGGELMDTFRMISPEMARAVMAARPMDELLTMLMERFHSGALAGNEAVIAQQLFARSFREWLPILNQGAEGLEHFKEMHGGISEADVKMATDFNRAWRELKEQLEDLARKLAADVLPYLKEFVEWLQAGVLAIELGHFAKFFELSMKAAIDGIGKYMLEKIQDWTLAIAKAQVNGLVALAGGIVDLVGPGIGASPAGNRSNQSITRPKEAKPEEKSAAEQLEEFEKEMRSEADAAKKQLNQSRQQITPGDLLKQIANLGQVNLKAMLLGGGDTEQTGAAGLTQRNIKAETELYDIEQRRSQLQQKLIKDDPFTTEEEKISALIPLLKDEASMLQNQVNLQELLASDSTRTESERNEAALKAVEWQQKLNDKIAEMAKLQRSLTFTDNLRQGLATLQSEWSNLGSNLAQGAIGAIKTGVDGISNAITNAIYHTRNWGQAFAQIGKSIVGSIIQIVVQWIASMTILRGLKALLGAEDLSQASASATAWAPAAIAASIASFGSADAIGSAAYASALISGTALTAGLAGFASGGIIPTGERLIRVNEAGQEAILNAAALRNVGPAFIQELNRGRFIPSLARSSGSGGSSGTGPGSGSGGQPIVQGHKVTIINPANRQEMLEALQSAEGEKIIVSHVKRNRMDIGVQT